jgi:hypothetical protein
MSISVNSPFKTHAEQQAGIQDYLGNGGLFNPEAMNHEKVRELLMSLRDDTRLGKVDRKVLIQNAFRMAHFKYNGRGPLWVFVRDLCGVGSTSATAICRECGWDPDQDLHDILSLN